MTENTEVIVVGTKSAIKIIVTVFLCVSVVMLAMLGVLPLFNKLLAVEVNLLENVPMTPAPLPDAPEELLLTAIYEMEEGAKKISVVYIEVFHVGSDTATYFEVPADTKINLSENLYKSLQTYAPELPQYLKLSNAAEGFSAEYGLTGCNRILSEVLGVSVKEYIKTDKESLAAWFASQKSEKTASGFFGDYTTWIANSSSSRMVEERWMYFESRKKIKNIVVELAPGSREKDGYLISGKRSKERLEELMLLLTAIKEQE